MRQKNNPKLVFSYLQLAKQVSHGNLSTTRSQFKSSSGIRNFHPLRHAKCLPYYTPLFKYSVHTLSCAFSVSLTDNLIGESSCKEKERQI